MSVNDGAGIARVAEQWPCPYGGEDTAVVDLRDGRFLGEAFPQMLVVGAFPKRGGLDLGDRRVLLPFRPPP